MTKFSNKKPRFWPILGPFSQFWGKKNFPRKSGSVTHNFIWVSSTMPNFRKTNDTIPRKCLDRRTGRTMEGWKDKQTMLYRRTKNKFTSCKQYLFGLIFSRNLKMSHTDQVYYKFFYSVGEETTHKHLKVATAQSLFSNVYLIVTTCFDKCFNSMW